MFLFGHEFILSSASRGSQKEVARKEDFFYSSSDGFVLWSSYCSFPNTCRICFIMLPLWETSSGLNRDCSSEAVVSVPWDSSSKCLSISPTMRVIAASWNYYIHNILEIFYSSTPNYQTQKEDFDCKKKKKQLWCLSYFTQKEFNKLRFNIVN